MNEYNRKDWQIAALVTLIVFILAAFTLTPGTNTWGDDNAAYLVEGISIAEGRFHEQAEINYQYHPSDLPVEADEGTLVYVWGYPLLLSIIYRITGFDQVHFASVIWYKIPSLLSLAFTGGVLTLFFRRRFSLYTAAGAALVFCMSGNLFESVNGLYSDLVFLFFSMLTLHLMECFISDIRDERQVIRPGLIYAVSMWMTYETRLSGFTVCGAALLGHAIAALRNKNLQKRKKIWQHLLPYLVTVLLIFLSEQLWLAPATQNLSEIGKPAEERIRYYCQMIFEFFDTMPRIPFKGAGNLFLAALVIGLVADGSKDNLHLTILLIGTLIVAVCLPYTNGQRYLYNVFPILVLYCLYGFQVMGIAICRIRKPKIRNIARIIALAAAAEILFFSCANQVYRGGYNLIHWGESYSYDMYSDEAKEMYHYIQESIPKDAVIAFGKPRALYLNTGRMSFRVNHNGHEMTDADYYMKHKIINLDDEEICTTDMETCRENNYLILYKITK